MDISKEYKTDEDLEVKGKEFDFGDDCFCTIARRGNPEYIKVMRRLMKPYKRQLRADRVPDAVQEEISIRVIAMTILKGWRGMKEDGVEVPYNSENCIRILTEYKDFREQVSEISDEMEHYRIADDEDAEGN
jgi:hypothetical protein